MLDTLQKSTLLDLNEIALFRCHLQGVPPSSLSDYCSGNDSPNDVIQRCNDKLILKARRIGLNWTNQWLIQNKTNLQLVFKELDRLQSSDDIAPEYSHPLCYWLADHLIENTKYTEIVTVKEWADTYQAAAGNHWWQNIGGLSPAKSRDIEIKLSTIFPGILDVKQAYSPVMPNKTNIAPLEQFILPERLNGATGINRASPSPLIPAKNDYDAVFCWLDRHNAQSHTRRSYQREAERLLLWAILTKKKPLSSLDMLDMKEYRTFLQSPEPTDIWVGKPRPRGHSDWKPFKGPLSVKSQRLAETILNSMFKFLVDTSYLLHNPLSLLPKLKDPSVSKMAVQRSFSAKEFKLIMSAIDNHLSKLEGKEKKKWLRTKLIIQIGYGTGMRIHEIANASLGDIEIRQRQSKSQYWLNILGKGNKMRDVPLSPELYKLMQDIYLALTGKSISRLSPKSPLIPPLRGAEEAHLSPTGIHKIIKQAFIEIANSLKDHPETADKILNASTHWLRHTHGSVAVDQGVPLNVVRDNLGHSNISTTSQYVHTEEDIRYNAIVVSFSEEK